ncbi:uncharacterized protein LOC106458417 isoform X2 [Limulus polyphemus]|nr:uncharacterized protein LOC106458417 isoform X2 [Limulus polyphemus]
MPYASQQMEVLPQDCGSFSDNEALPITDTTYIQYDGLPQQRVLTSDENRSVASKRKRDVVKSEELGIQWLKTRVR